ncbi:MAG: PD40 domain-containing protein [Sedimentisphaerales bacterium]|nr:PD40 domain-containing protein [Sedimentisphaerales bacterium]
MGTLIVGAGVLAWALRAESAPVPRGQIGRKPRIHPDYTDIVIPPNIAPLNFAIQETGTHYFVTISAPQGAVIERFSRTGRVTIPMKAWRRLLEANRGQDLHIDALVQRESGSWEAYATVTNHIAEADVDGYLVYRKMHPIHTLFYGPVGLYQRDLHTYDETLILDKSYWGEGGCINCHSFCQNRPDKAVIGVRSPQYGNATLLIDAESADKIDAKFGYSSWHPSGRLVTYSVDNLPMFFHTSGQEVRDTVDLDSLLAYYLVDRQVLKTAGPLARKDRLETWPCWSAEGRYLYFCSAPLLWSDTQEIPPPTYRDVRYDLVRIPYDLEQDQWDDQETVVSAADTGKSAGMPRTSPDGRWLSFCLSDYGFFPTWQSGSDLYLVDLHAERIDGRLPCAKLAANSDRSESWHSWSSNSRWLAFSSKRDCGVFTRLYLSYIDPNGCASKPFILPQKDPRFYDSCLYAYNTCELTVAPMQTGKERLGRIVRRSKAIAVDLPVTQATPKAGLGVGTPQGPPERE